MKKLSSPAIGLYACLLAPLFAQAQTTPLTYSEWVTNYGLSGAQAQPSADPDGDGLLNSIEYALGTDPTVANNPDELNPTYQFSGGVAEFQYRKGDVSAGNVEYILQRSDNLKDWYVPLIQLYNPQDMGPYDLQGGSVLIGDAPTAYFRLLARVNVPLLGGGSGAPSVVVQMGQTITSSGNPVDGAVWQGLSEITPTIRTEAPDVNDPAQNPPTTPNTTKYPGVAGAKRLPITLESQGSRVERPVNWRSWLGWFALGDGVPPPGVSAGYPVYVEKNGEDYLFNDSNWDYYAFKTQDPGEVPEGQTAKSEMRAVRVDQQPLYLNPWRINYQFAPGAFGWKKKPMEPFRDSKLHYWADKTIVRGVNLSLPYPFLQQKGDFVSTNPEGWEQQPLFVRTRPLETLVVVPSNLPPQTLNSEGAWNRRSTGPETGAKEPFPYPVWDPQASPEEQTPYNLKIDRIGDFDVEFVWEGTNPDYDADYLTKRYRYTDFHEEGQGNYLKMTASQSSPFLWCEAHNSQYMIFYNMIRSNQKYNVNNYDLHEYKGGDSTDPANYQKVGETGAKFIKGQDVPGLPGVKYVLAYGNQLNPNQFYMEVEPLLWDIPRGRVGGWNPPGSVDNFTYIAIFYKADTVKPFELDDVTGTDADGNRYLALEFNEPEAKNWFVVGAIPVMRYYDPNINRADEAAREAAAHAWAKQLAKFAFNFSTGSEIDYDVDNMNLVKTTFSHTLKNPFIASGAPNAAGTTVDPNLTVMNLMPHQYQPITLGTDPVSGEPVKWLPYRDFTLIFPNPNIGVPSANWNPTSGEAHWGYWTPKGNLHPIVAKSFRTFYPFQNFLPVTPPPNFDKTYKLTGVQAVYITPPTDPAQNKLYAEPAQLDGYYDAHIEVLDGSTPSKLAKFKVLIEPNTDQVLQVDVIDPGKGYPSGNPPDLSKVKIVIQDPIIPGGRTATARLQINGDGAVDAVFMVDKGSGYRHIVKVTKNPSNPNEVDAPLIKPRFASAEERPIPGDPEHTRTWLVGLAEGFADVISGGAGFVINQSQQPSVEVLGTGTGATATILKPGNLVDIKIAGIGFFSAQGAYPSSGDLVADAQKIQVHIPPAEPGGESPEAEVSLAFNPNVYNIAVYNPGSGFTDTVGPERRVVGSFKNKDGKEVEVDAVILNNKILNVGRSVGADPAALMQVNAPTEVDFLPAYSAAKALVYPQASVANVHITDNKGVSYAAPVEVGFTGGAVGGPGFVAPEIDFHLDKDSGQWVIDQVVNPGADFYDGGQFIVMGGRGFNAALQPIITPDGRLVDVIVLRGGSNYLPDARAHASTSPLLDPETQAPLPVTQPEVQLVIEDGVIVDAIVPADKQGANIAAASIELYGPAAPNDPTGNNAKGPFARIAFGAQNGGIVNPVFVVQGQNYVPGISTSATPDSLPAYLHIDQTSFQALPANQASGYLTDTLPHNVKVEQVLFDSTSALYSRYANIDQRPFGAGFTSGSPDGYGLGNQFSSITKTIGILFNLYQHDLNKPDDAPKVTPSKYVLDAVNQPVAFPVYRENHPVVSLQKGLQTGVQGLQRALTLLFQDPPYQNTGTADANWKMEYYNQYDANVGRTVINPTATLPASGIASASGAPPPIPVEENQPKIDSGDALRIWKPGLLFSGFGVSDQWNDQHYFYGYYLSTAGVAAILEGAWLTDDQLANIDLSQTNLWSDEDFAGRAIDQWLQTYAYDPELASIFYQQDGMAYQDFAFFDRYNGHPWATGSQPPDSVATFYTNPPGEAPNTWNDWRSWGIHNGIFGDENENSTWEGLQAYSAAILWGAGTNRREIVDLGIYLLSTGIAGSDFYFLDKNYNYKDSDQNDYSWTPTVSAAVTDHPSEGWTPAGGNQYVIGDGYVSSNPEAFYGNASAGAAIIRKYGPTIDTFFYAYPTGPKFIEAYPPTPWNMGMSRNSEYMKDWASVYTRPEWRVARESGLYQSAIWNSLAMTASIAGVPHAPGDSPNSDAYVNRIWSGWYSRSTIAGDNVSVMPSETGLSTMNFLHTLQEYGTPDWTLVAKVVTAAGASSNKVVFTAAYTKPHPTDQSKVVTTLVAFNPGWTEAYVNFLPILNDGVGNFGDTPLNATPIQVKPKRMVMQQIERTKQ